ncbi:MAG: trypsin-like serine protease [Micromonosporaceae bacterium]|nr:trypsin-like serine protease [Micromonosporaceae bacterium]
MRLNRTGRGRWLRAALVVGATTAVAAGMLASPASAKRIDPNTATSSDGSVGAAVDMAAASRSVSAYEGTGKRAGNGASRSDNKVKPYGAGAEGDVGAESVIGPDGRWRVTPTTSFPTRAIAMITLNGSQLCTGWLYGPDVLATAGHCVHTGGSGGAWRSGTWRIYPGRDGSSSPYGYCTARSLHSVNGWTQSRDEQYDYGAIKLNCTIGNTVGWFGFWWQSASLTGYSTTVSGYPGDKPSGTHWRHVDSVRVTQARQIFYQNDTFGGQSGSPVYQYRSGCGYCSMGIHAYGLHGSWPHSSNNHGTRINEPVYNNMLYWRNL